MIRVLEVAGDGTVSVDASGLFRVVIRPENEIADELVTAEEAAAFVDSFNRCHPNRIHWAEAVSYMANLILVAISTSSLTCLSV